MNIVEKLFGKEVRSYESVDDLSEQSKERMLQLITQTAEQEAIQILRIGVSFEQYVKTRKDEPGESPLWTPRQQFLSRIGIYLKEFGVDINPLLRQSIVELLDAQIIAFYSEPDKSRAVLKAHTDKVARDKDLEAARERLAEAPTLLNIQVENGAEAVDRRSLIMAPSVAQEMAKSRRGESRTKPVREGIFNFEPMPKFDGPESLFLSEFPPEIQEGIEQLIQNAVKQEFAQVRANGMHGNGVDLDDVRTFSEYKSAQLKQDAKAKEHGDGLNPVNLRSTLSIRIFKYLQEKGRIFKSPDAVDPFFKSVNVLFDAYLKILFASTESFEEQTTQD